MNVIEKAFERQKSKKQYDDMEEHYDTLLKYGKKVNHITEFGVDDGSSTWSWLLAASLDKNKIIRSYDIYPDCLIQEHIRLAEQENIDFKFICQDTLDPEFEIEETDLLFIDTLHNYKQLKAELYKHGAKVTKYLIFHDTTLYGLVDQSGYHKGLKHAISEWLAENPNVWDVKEVFTNCNGLTILGRI
jgi:hypothetical protein